ncbi:MAG: competence protein CoiA [Pseudonocardiaceae bacterium]
MMLANTIDAPRTAPLPGARGTCPVCEADVIAKCGTVNVWHWAHAAGTDCDPWAESGGMSEWHLGWQNEVPAEQREIVIGNHRADIVTARGHVVEVQHSFISEEELLEREAFYVEATGKRMFWIFDAAKAMETRHEGPCATDPLRCSDITHEARLDLRKSDGASDGMYRTFRWKHARKSVAVAGQTVFLDLGRGWLLLLKRIYPEAPVGGWGYLWTREQVVACMNQGVNAA